MTGTGARPQPIHFLGRGLVSALGTDATTLGAALRAGVVVQERVPLGNHAQSVPYYRIAATARERPSTRAFDLLDWAVDTALRDADLTADSIRDLGVFIGSTALDIAQQELRYAQQLASSDRALALPQPGLGVLADHLALRLELRVPPVTLSTACSASANALLFAAEFVRAGRFAAALVVGAETFNLTTLHGFDSLMLVSRERMRPFDSARDGLVLGEAVGAVVIGTATRKSNERTPRYVAGATLCDTTSVTTSSADSIANVVQLALSRAGLGQADIHAIKAHGTGTQANDVAEAQGLKQVFGGALPPVTSVKPYFGHTLGACGIVELIAMLAAIEEGFIPGTPGFEHVDEQVGFAPARVASEFAAGNVLLNYFGFGGNNTALVLSSLP